MQESIKCINPSLIVCYDLETTGINPKNDEILQFSAVDGDGNVLLNTYVKPLYHQNWYYAERVNGISPSMVADAPTIVELLPTIQGIMNSARTIVGYNHCHFDNKFLNELGIKFKTGIIQDDVMMDFAKLMNINDIKHGHLKCFKLIECAKYFGYEFKPHDSLEDTRATLYCFKAIQKLKYK